jgi:hypothetical protein
MARESLAYFSKLEIQKFVQMVLSETARRSIRRPKSKGHSMRTYAIIITANVGKILFENGEATEVNQPEHQSIDAYNIYFELHPDDQENYKLVEGNSKTKPHHRERRPGSGRSLATN